ncbi:hypothetical protein [Desulfoluna butyratoxydans]|uniref:Phage tail tape measure protein n=1 Tax=Desulfoluna butyratoxydans TaxID=231438 RepID=A0A4U8YHN9_9BACT|nr:hypothetical protein [Desulfoluna butyratoxydans]VFQ42479.1 hypothetical protein MSL71_970 [Desulfoluna butyratoxydans]
MASTDTLTLPTGTSAAQAMVAAGEAVIDQISRVGQSLKGFSLGLSSTQGATGKAKKNMPGAALTATPKQPKTPVSDALSSLAPIITDLGKAVAPLQETGELAQEAWEKAKGGVGSAFAAVKALRGKTKDSQPKADSQAPAKTAKTKRQKKPGKTKKEAGDADGPAKPGTALERVTAAASKLGSAFTVITESADTAVEAWDSANEGMDAAQSALASLQQGLGDADTAPDGSILQSIQATAGSFQSALGSIQELGSGEITLPASLAPLTTVVTDFGEGLESIQDKAATAQEVWSSAKEGVDAAKNAWASLKQGFGKKSAKNGEDAENTENPSGTPGSVFQGIGTAASSFQTALGSLKGLDTGDITLPASLAPLTTVVTDFSDGLGSLQEKAASAQEAWDSAKEGVDAAKNVWAGLKQGLGGSKKGEENASGKAGGKSKKAPGDIFQNAKKATAAFETTLGRIGQVAHMDLGLPAQFAPLQSMLSNVGSGIDAVQEKAETAKAIWGNTRQGLDMVKTGLTTMSGMGGPIGGVATKLLSMGSGVKALGGTFMGFAGRVIPMMAGGIRALSAAFMANPIGIAIAGIAMAAVLIIKFWKPLGAFFKGLFGGIMGLVKGVLGWLMPTFKVIGAVWKTLSGIFSRKKKSEGEEPKEKEAPPKDKKSAKAAGKTKPGTALAKSTGGARIGNTPKPGSTASKPKPVRKSKVNKRQKASGGPDKRAQATRNKSKKRTSAGGGPINIYVYGAEGQSTRELAQEVLRHLKHEQARRLYD